MFSKQRLFNWKNRGIKSLILCYFLSPLLAEYDTEFDIMLAKALIGIAAAVHFAELTSKGSKHFIIETQDNGETEDSGGTEDSIESSDHGLSELQNYGR